MRNWSSEWWMFSNKYNNCTSKMKFVCKSNRNVRFCSTNATKLSLLTSIGFDIDAYSLAFVVMRRVKERILWQGEYLSNTNVDLNWDSISTFFLGRLYIYKKLQGHRWMWALAYFICRSKEIGNLFVILFDADPHDWWHSIQLHWTSI